MDALGVLQDDELRVVVEADAQFLAGCPAVCDEARAELGIDPGPRHDFRAQRGRAEVEHLDQTANLACDDELLFDEKLADGDLHHLEIAWRGVVRLTRMPMLMIVGVVLSRHRQILSSQVSKISMRSPSRFDPA